MAKSGPKTIDAYIAAQPDAARPVLERLRAILRKALPDAEEAISYGIPGFKIGGRSVIFFAGWRAHASLYPATGRVATELAGEIAPYKASKGTLKFPLGRPIPARLVTRIARLRAEETRDRLNAKAAKPRRG